MAVETVGNWYWVVDELEAAGCRPQLVHAYKAKVMLGSVNKTDHLDARGLVRLQRAGTLPVVWIPPRELRDARELPRAQMVLVQQRTPLKNRIHATLARYAPGALGPLRGAWPARVAGADRGAAAPDGICPRLAPRAGSGVGRRHPGPGAADEGLVRGGPAGAGDPSGATSHLQLAQADQTLKVVYRVGQPTPEHLPRGPAVLLGSAAQHPGRVREVLRAASLHLHQYQVR